MRGLFLKDYYLFLKKCRNMSILILFAVLAPLTVPNLSFFTFYPVLFISMVPMTLIAYDAGDKWNQYAAAMPFSKRDLVVEKYLFGLIVSSILIVLTVASEIIVSAAKGRLDLLHDVDLTMRLLSLCLVSPALMLPFVFRYGVEKGRIAYYIVVGGACAIVIGSSPAVGGYPTVEQIGNKIGFVVPAVSILVYLISIILSVRFYNRKQAE